MCVGPLRIALGAVCGKILLAAGVKFPEKIPVWPMHIILNHIGPYRIAAYYSAQITRRFVLLAKTCTFFFGSNRIIIPGRYLAAGVEYFSKKVSVAYAY